MAEHIIAVFDSESLAAAAARSLTSVGIPASAIRQYAAAKAGVGEYGDSESTTTRKAGGGFWAWLLGDEEWSDTTAATYATDRDLYEQRAQAGNVIVSVMVEDDAKIHQAIEAIEAHDPLDIDEYTDEAGPSRHGTPVDVDSAIPGGRVGGSAYTTPMVAPSGAGRETSPTATAGSTKEEIIPLAEEQLNVGKRTVDRGTTRIRRYVVEKPVEQSVSLQSERVTVEKRRPIETTVAPATGAFEERVVEVRETAEEPVVAKTAQVVEEVVVGREATERTETVKDTVRREEVEVTGVSKADRA